MGVFEKIYTESYDRAREEYEKVKDYTDFNFYQIYMTALTRTFNVKNIEFDIRPFMIEFFFQERGMVGMNKNKEIYPVAPEGELLPNGEFSRYRMIRCNGETTEYNKDDIVVGYNNCFMSPLSFFCYQFAQRSSYALRAVDSALSKATLPVVINFPDERALKEYEDLAGKEHLYPFKGRLSGKFDDGKIDIEQPFDNRSNDVLALWDVYVRYRNLFYSQIGINNVEIQKRERLTEAEGSGNDEIVRYSLLWDMFDCRRNFAKRCKEKFGAKIEFELNRDIATVYDILLDNKEKVETGNIIQSKGANIQQPQQKDTEVKEDENSDK